MGYNGIDFAECPVNLIDGWIKRGNDEPDILFKFVAYWIAFNQMYNLEDVNETMSERKAIEQFCIKQCDTIIDALDFGADYMKIFKERPILRWLDTTGRYDWREGKEFVADMIMERLSFRKDRPYFEKNCKEAAAYYVNICNPRCRNSDKAIALMMSIYRVRSNLFHGIKDPDTKRNYDLIKSSAEILENCLPALRAAMYGNW